MPRVLAAGLSFVLLTAGAGCGEPPPERIVLIVVDTLRRDHLGAYGARRPTPAIDALARRGRAYADYRSSFHQTSMSMAALFTGRIPSIESTDPAKPLPWTGDTWCGMSRFRGRDAPTACIPAVLPTLAGDLNAAGYWTIGVASNHFLYEPSGYGRGFDDWVEVGRPPPASQKKAPAEAKQSWRERRWPRVQAAVVEALARRPQERLFLYVHYMDVHDWGFAGKGYASSVAVADEAVGALVDHLEREGLLEDAVVLFTSDHGERLDETHPPFFRKKPSHNGNPSFEEYLEVPLIVAPALDPEVGLPARSQDLFHVVRRIAGLEATTPGRLAADELFLGELRHRTYSRGRWKSMEQRGTGRAMLFDLEKDPREQRDVSASHSTLR